MSKLEQNTTSLTNLLNKANALPSAPPDVEQATPTITVSSDGVVTASSTQSAGKVSAGTKSTTKQLDTQGAKTVVPTTEDVVAVGRGKYTTGEVRVAGDPNLKPENVKQGIGLFGIVGTHSGGADVSGVTAAAGDVLVPKKFVNSSGSLESGTMPNNGSISKTMDGLNIKSVSIPKGYTDGGTVSLTGDIDNIADTQADKIAQIKTALEGKAAGGGGAIAIGTFSVTDNGMYEPGVNEYILSSNDLNASERLHIAIEIGRYVLMTLSRNSTGEGFVVKLGFTGYSTAQLSAFGASVDNDSITVLGTISQSEPVYFYAF